MPAGWKSYPKPNPWFKPREPSAVVRWFEAFLRLLLCLAWAAFVGGLLLVCGSYFLAEYRALTAAIGVYGAFAGWSLVMVALPVYRTARIRRIAEAGEFIPALTEARGISSIRLVLLEFPLATLSLGASLIFSILLGMERHRKVRLSAHFVVNGRRRRQSVFVPDDSRPDLLNDEVVWVTRPCWLVPPQPVDRLGRIGFLDHATSEARDWLIHARHRVDQRAVRIRQIRRRARAIRRIRHDKGRDHRYA